MPLVVGLTGLAGSGKGIVSDYLTSKYHFKKLVFSDVVREEAEKRGLLTGKTYEQQKYVLSQLGETMRKESRNWSIIAEKLVETINSNNYEKSVVDGFRSVEEVDLFRKNFEKFYLVFMYADEKIRFLRRKKEDPSVALEDLRRRDKENIEVMGLGKVIKMADFTIDNNEQGTEHLYKKVDKIMKKISL